MQRNLAQSLFEHGEVRTTLAKAKDVRPFAERLITLAKKARGGSITARRRIHQLLGDRSLVPAEHQEEYDLLSDVKRAKALRAPSGRRHRRGEPKGKLAFTGETVIHRLVDKIAPKYEDRPGGYTRVIRLPDRRIGDHSELALVQLIGDEQGPGSLTRRRKTARRKRADARYAAAIKATKGAGRRKTSKDEAESEGQAEPASDESRLNEPAAPEEAAETNAPAAEEGEENKSDS